MDKGPLGSKGSAAVPGAATAAAGLRDRLRATTEPIRSACEVLQEQLRPTLPAELHHDLDRIVAATQALLRLVEGVEEPSEEDRERAQAVRRKIAHDLRNPVSVMAGYAELLAEEIAELPDGIDVDLEGFAEMVRAFATRIDQVIEDGKYPEQVPAKHRSCS